MGDLETEEPLLKRNIAYKEHMCAPLTQLDILAETFSVSQRSAWVCIKRHVVVIFASATNRPAMNIHA